MSANNITFILHKPQLSENIGACARGMKNFNFQKLSVIDPKPIFPNDKILATSVGAKNIINKSKIFDNLEPALKNIDYVIATSARFRNKSNKSEVWEIGKELGILKEIIEAAPTDGLWDDGRTDEGQLGFKYKDLEDAMKNPNSPHRQEYEKIRKQNLHKMEPIPVCKIPN